MRTVASSRQQGVRQGTSPETATNAPRATARPTAAAATATAVDGTPCTSTAKACVDVADRQAWLIDKGVVTRGPVQVMTGDNDDPTPLGTFHVQWKAEQYTSRQYLTQMPYSVFFADGGVAFHEGPQDTYSAGCVKLVHTTPWPGSPTCRSATKSRCTDRLHEAPPDISTSSRMRTVPTLGELERAVMEALWSADGAVTAREVQDALAGRELATTTVLTVLGRLERKGLVTRERSGRAHRYRSVASRADHVAELMRDALDATPDRGAALARFLGSIPDDERAALRDLLD